MIEYYLGIDGGGSKTHCALFSKQGLLIDFIEWGTTSHEFLPDGYEDLKIQLKELFNTIQKRNDLNWKNVRAVFGMAGVDCEKQRLLISRYIKDCGVENFLLCNDSFLGIKTGTDKGWGICSMNGSGTGAGGIDIDGNTHMVGRLFELSGDYAGGKILGAEVIRCVYDSLFRDGQHTELSRLVFNKCGVENRDDLMEEIVSGIANHTLESKDFAHLLFDAACLNDAVVLEILTKCGYQNARDIIEVAKELNYPDSEEIPVVLLGSLYTKIKNNQIIKSLKKNLGEKFKLIELPWEPVTGAVCWAMEIDNIKFDRKEIGKQIIAIITR